MDRAFDKALRGTIEKGRVAMENKLDISVLMTDQMKAVIAKQNELAENAFATNVGFEEMRTNYLRERAFWNEGGPSMSRTVDMMVDGPVGQFAVRRYYPLEAKSLPGIVYVHGGGFVVGNLDTHDRVCRILAHETGAVVAAVDYHLSPESKYPVNIQECALVAQLLHEGGEEMGIDGDDLSFAGDSGGAVLSMAANLWLRDEEQDNSYIRTLLLYYGFYGLLDSCSRRLYGGDIDGMGKADFDYYIQCWLSDPACDLESPYVDMLANDLKADMPSCYVASAGLDPLKDDSACLAAVLKENGIPCEYENFDGVLHAFVHHSRMLDEANDCLKNSATFWKKRHAAR